MAKIVTFSGKLIPKRINASTVDGLVNTTASISVNDNETEGTGRAA